MAIYSGFTFPLPRNARGWSATDSSLIKADLRLLCSQGLRERVMRPEAGNEAERFVFENEDMDGSLASAIAASWATCDPRVRVLQVTPTTEVQSDGTVVKYVYIEYYIPALGSQDSLSLEYA